MVTVVDESLLNEHGIFKFLCASCRCIFYSKVTPFDLSDRLTSGTGLNPNVDRVRKHSWWTPEDKETLAEKSVTIVTLCDECRARGCRQDHEVGRGDIKRERRCAFCFRFEHEEGVVLLQHHWFEPKTFVECWTWCCYSCNGILRTNKGNNNHILPSLEAQRDIVLDGIARKVWKAKGNNNGGKGNRIPSDDGSKPTRAVSANPDDLTNEEVMQ